MTEGKPNQARTELEQGSGIYLQTFQILETYGKPFYNQDGKTLTASSFFCDPKDFNHSSSIDIFREVDLGPEAKRTPITVTVVREYRNDRALVRELTILPNGDIKLKIKKRTGKKEGYSFEDLQPRDPNQYKPSMETIEDWLTEAQINLQARIFEPPCEDKPGKPIFIRVSSKLADALNRKRGKIQPKR